MYYDIYDVIANIDCAESKEAIHELFCMVKELQQEFLV